MNDTKSPDTEPAKNEPTKNESTKKGVLTWLPIVASVVALVISIYGFYVQDQLTQTNILASRLQSVTERSLDVDKFLADKEALSQIVFQTDSTKAGEIYVLDFDQYLWNNIRTIINPDASSIPALLVLRNPPTGATRVPRTPGWNDDQWESWITWSETIAGGFRPNNGVPSDLCRQLNAGRDAYGSDFIDAILDTHLCPEDLLPATHG
jgi:hypothetical protein